MTRRNLRREAPDEWLANRVRRLPGRIQRTARKLIELEREALSYRMDDVLADRRHLDRAWEREVELIRQGQARKTAGQGEHA